MKISPYPQQLAKIRSLPAFLYVLVFSMTNINAQVLVNKQWQTSTGNPSSGIEWSASVADISGNTYTTGHLVNTFFDIELYLVKKGSNGQTIWEKNFSLGSGTKSYGIEMVLNDTNLYVAGATYNVTNGNHDYLILKYDTTGTQSWYITYNGAANGEDIPSSITCDSGGNIFVTGGSYGGASDYDYLTLKLSPTGIINWIKTYDYSNLRDGAAAVTVDPNGDVIVAGASENTANNWDYATIKYGNSLGSVLQEKRVASGNIGLDVPLGFATDNSGNFYITGYGVPGSDGNDIYTLKLDNELNVIWENFYDGEGLDDQGFDIEVDDNGNVYTCGYVNKANGGSDYILIKYDNDGDELWVRRRACLEPTNQSIARHIKEDSYGNLVIAGEETIGNNSLIKTISYDPEGELLWENKHDGDAGVKEKSLELISKNGGNIVVVSHVRQNPSGAYQLINYKIKDVEITYDYDPDTVATNVHGELIIRFNPQVVDTAFADNPDLIFGTIGQIITDAVLIAKMDQLLDIENNSRLEDWVMYKLFPFLTTADRFIPAKSGEIKPIPSLWTCYVLRLESSISVFDAQDSLENIDYQSILYSTPNYVMRVQSPPLTDANDEYYTYQDGLYSATVGINIEPAWDEVDGSADVRVGFVDTGLNFDHPDYGANGGFGGLKESVVEAGFFMYGSLTNYTDSDGLSNDPGWGHGTRVASIVGALRNNEIGISGIAGGDIEADPNNRGVKLYAFDATDSELGDLYLGTGMQGILYAATGATVIGEGTGPPLVDFLNCSWGRADFSDSAKKFITEIMEVAYKSETTTLFSRGNEGNNADFMPATLNDKWIISVGASGTDGNLLVETNNSQGTFNEPNTFNEPLLSSYGNGMDLIAPGTNDLIVTINNQFPAGPLINCSDGFLSDNLQYNCFNGTSSAVAHATGVAALLLEKHREYNIELLPEDIKRLINYGATDLGSTGYDESTGWGRLNAGASMGLISDGRKVIHIKAIPEIEVICDGCGIELTRIYDNPYSDYNGDGIFPKEIPFPVKVIKHTAEINLDVCNYNAQILDPGISLEKDPAWVLNSISNLWGEVFFDPENGPLYNIINPEDAIYWESGPTVSNGNCILSGTISGYSYEITSGDAEGEIIPNPGEAPYVMWFSLLVDDPNGTMEDEEIIIANNEELVRTSGDLKISPNPVTNTLFVNADINGSSSTDLSIFDLNGRQIKSVFYGYKNTGTHQWEVPVERLVSGIYILKLQTDAGLQIGKFIKI